MAQLVHLIVTYGVPLIFINVFLEQLGVPVPAVPTLVVAAAVGNCILDLCRDRGRRLGWERRCRRPSVSSRNRARPHRPRKSWLVGATDPRIGAGARDSREVGATARVLQTTAHGPGLD